MAPAGAAGVQPGVSGKTGAIAPGRRFVVANQAGRMHGDLEIALTFPGSATNNAKWNNDLDAVRNK
jgi:hypothetical protein